MEITRELKIEDHAKVVFNLRSLKQNRLIIKQEKDKAYALIMEGEHILKCLDLMEHFVADSS